MNRSVRLAVVLLLLVSLVGPVAPALGAPPAAGRAVPAGLFAQAAKLSRGRALDLSAQPLVLSNSPEFPNRPGILAEVDNVLSGRFRLLYSHDNLLFDLTPPLVDDPATRGFAVVNHTGRAVSLSWTRFSTVRTTDEKGTPAGPADFAPSTGGTGPGPDFGGREGATLVEKWFASGDGSREHWLADLPPGGSYLYRENVGPGVWAKGLFDFVLRDRNTGHLLTKGSVPGGVVGVEVLITRFGTDLASFYRLADKLGLIAPADDAQGAVSPITFHQRGIFAGADRAMTIRYDPGMKPVAVEAAQQYFAENHDPGVSPGYEPNMFPNDVSVGRDDHPSVPAQDSGDYGVQYVFRLRLSGPAAVAVQPALYGGGRAPADMYDQHLVFDLDGDIQTVSFLDPRYDDYYRSPGSLSPPGWGKVVFVLPSPSPGYTHVLRITLPPNGYGPFVILIMPVPGPGGR